jgi:hypothetical protein
MAVELDKSTRKRKLQITPNFERLQIVRADQSL